MKRLYGFLTLMTFLSVFSLKADFNASKVFRDTLKKELVGSRIYKEFKGWDVARGKTDVFSLFSSELEYSKELKGTYDYYNDTISKVYTGYVRDGVMSIDEITPMILCNTDVIISLLRKSLIKHGMEMAAVKPASKLKKLPEKKKSELTKEYDRASRTALDHFIDFAPNKAVKPIKKKVAKIIAEEDKVIELLESKKILKNLEIKKPIIIKKKVQKRRFWLWRLLGGKKKKVDKKTIKKSDVKKVEERLVLLTKDLVDGKPEKKPEEEVDLVIKFEKEPEVVINKDGEKDDDGNLWYDAEEIEEKVKPIKKKIIKKKAVKKKTGYNYGWFNFWKKKKKDIVVNKLDSNSTTPLLQQMKNQVNSEIIIINEKKIKKRKNRLNRLVFEDEDTSLRDEELLSEDKDIILTDKDLSKIDEVEGKPAKEVPAEKPDEKSAKEVPAKEKPANPVATVAIRDKSLEVRKLLSEEEVMAKMKKLQARVDELYKFEKKLRASVVKIVRNKKCNRSKINEIINDLACAKKGERIITKVLSILNKQLSMFIKTKIAKKKAVSEYNLLERVLLKINTVCSKDFLEDILALQRINTVPKEVKPLLNIALNVKNLILKKIVKRCCSANKFKAAIYFYKKRKEALTFIGALAQ